jgi:hypothetical protein
MSELFDNNKVCIIIASHISNPKRIGHLIECLTSLLKQTIIIPIYLCISFENKELQNQYAVLFSENTFLHNTMLHNIIRTTKTPQMRHMEKLLYLIENKHDWIMFCDDDDTYEPQRVEIFINTIKKGLNDIRDIPEKQFVGIYESVDGKPHHEKRQEYWCYCVHIQLLSRFMKILRPYPDVIDNKCCDVLFGEYLRRLNPDLLYAIITLKLYNYRVDNNTDSITGEIKQQSNIVRKPMTVTPDTMEECAKDLDNYLDDHIDIYLHDTYLRTIVGMDFHTILKHEFMEEYNVLNLVKTEHMQKIFDFHSRLRQISNLVFDIKLQN